MKIINNAILVVIVVFVIGFTYGCSNDDQVDYSCPETPDYSNVDEEQLEKDIQALDAYLGENNITAQIHESGLRYEILEEGSGDIPTLCQFVTINYTGKITETGEVFDQTSPGEPRTFNLSNLILGWQAGIPLISEGGKIRLYIPAQLAYGKPGRVGSIPPNANLTFDVELINVQ